MMLPLRSKDMSTLLTGHGVSGGTKKSREMGIGRGGGAMRVRSVVLSDSALQ
jgi:hypothetical protein